MEWLGDWMTVEESAIRKDSNAANGLSTIYSLGICDSSEIDDPKHVPPREAGECDPELMGNLAGRLNSSCDPNCEVNPVGNFNISWVHDLTAFEICVSGHRGRMAEEFCQHDQTSQCR